MNNNNTYTDFIINDTDLLNPYLITDEKTCFNGCGTCDGAYG